MPLWFLFAMVLAFGLDTIEEGGPLGAADLQHRLVEAGLGLLAVGLAACVLGRTVARAVRRHGQGRAGVRRLHNLGALALEFATLGYYGWVIHGLDWPRVVDWGFGLRGAILGDELLILLPYLLAQLAVWWGLYPGERALRAGKAGASRTASLGRYLVLKARLALALALPVVLIYTLGRDVLGRAGGDSSAYPGVELAQVAGMALLVLVLAPLFVRLMWPARPLEPGPLRDRLERLARRFGFRCTDILVWDTGGTVVNAAVTGALPWFRYVLLTDELIACLDDREIEAVFGHEVGHISHRHLPFFGVFFLGSLGVLALFGHGIDLLLPPAADRYDLAGEVVRGLLGLATLAVYFLLLFGYLSRRFERQADVFGCRAVSCGRANCPPHPDLNAHPTAEPDSADLCPVGIRTFASALSKVADLNGMEEGTLAGLLAWRHGSVSRRIAFLLALEGHPEAEGRFQRGVRRLRYGLVAALAAALALAVATDSIRHLTG